MTCEAPICWICRSRSADSREHRFKASDIRRRLGKITQQSPAFLQRGRATNDRIGSARNRLLAFKSSICTECNNVRTQPYDIAWETLSEYLHSNWPSIVRRGRFTLSKAFPGRSANAALKVHLYFLKLFGCKIYEDKMPIELSSFSKALLTEEAHPEIVLQIADCNGDRETAVAYETEIYTMRDRLTGELHGATWAYLIFPVAVKVSWIKAGAPLYTPGWAWRPSAHIKVVRLAPYMGATELKAGPAALTEPEE